MRKKQITFFSVDWYNCGLCSALDKVHERTSIYLRKNLVKIEKFDGLNELLEIEEVFVSRDEVSRFFEFVNKVDLNNEWKTAYEVIVCDGSEWEMRLRYDDGTVKLIKGTIIKPNNGRKIEKMINDMLFNETCIEKPILFGC